MFCSQCGHPNTDNSAFCVNCGASLPDGGPPQKAQPSPPPTQYPQYQYAQQNQHAQQNQYEPQGQYYQHTPYMYPQAPQKKSRRGLIVGLSIALAVVLLGIAAVLLLGGGGEIVGVWYCEEYGEAMEFKEGGTVDIYTASQDYSGKYDYAAKNGKGVIHADDGEFPFTVKGDTLRIEGRRVFERAGKKFDIPAFMEREDAPATAKPDATPRPTMAQPTAKPAAAPVKGTATEQTMTLQFAFGKRTGEYTGELLDGLPHGQGTFMTSSEDGTIWSYEGGWEAGHFSGEGTTYWEDGFSEGGWYEDDALNGRGWESWYDMLQYEGGYRSGMFHGNGALYDCFGEIVYEGAFENGMIVESEANRTGRVGAFKNQSVPTEHADLYDACNEGIDIRAEVTGQVFDVYYEPGEYPGYCYLYLFNPYSNDYEITGVFYYLHKGETPPNIDQIVTVWGTPQYLYTFTDTDNNEWTIPQLMAWSVE